MQTLLSTPLGTALRLHRFFNQAFKLRKEHPEAAVLRYAISMTSSRRVPRDQWDLYLSLLLKTSVVDSSCISDVCRVIVTYFRRGYPVPEKIVSEFIESTILRNAPLQNHSEILWSLLLARDLKVKISHESEIYLAEISSSFCAIVALHLRKLGLTSKNFFPKLWRDTQNSDGLYSDLWLLAYEARVRNWIPGNVNYIKNDTYFKILEKSKVRFYREDARIPSFSSKQAKKQLNRGLTTEFLTYGQAPFTAPVADAE